MFKRKLLILLNNTLRTFKSDTTKLLFTHAKNEMALAPNWTLITVETNNINSNLARSSHTLNTIGNKLFIFGGENQPRVPIDNNLLIFDTAQNEWSMHETNKQESQGKLDLPSPRLGHAACSLGDKLYVFGGRESVHMGDSSLNDLYEFDMNESKWSKLEPRSDFKPDKRSYHSMCALDSKLYVFGGCSADHGRLNDLFEFDLNEQKWAKLASNEVIVPRGGACLNAYKNSKERCLYLLGGFCGHELDECWKYDLNTNEWIQIESLPRSLSVFASASVLDNYDLRLVVHGGEVDPSTLGHDGAGEFSRSTYVYNGVNWSLLEFSDEDIKPTSRGWHAGAYSNGSFYMYGGNLENNKRSNELWQLKFN